MSNIYLVQLFYNFNICDIEHDFDHWKKNFTSYNQIFKSN